MRTTSPTLLRCLAGALLFVGSASCASDNGASSSPGVPVAQQIVEVTANATLAPTWYSSPLEATPLTTFTIDGVEQAEAVSDLFVVGTVDSVTAGAGYSWPTGPQKTGGQATTKIHSFNHPDAWMSTIHLNVSVDSSLERDTALAEVEAVTIGLALLNPVDMSSLTADLVGQRIAAPLHANEKSFFSGESGVYGILLSGEMLGFVDNEQVVSFPALRQLTPSGGGAHQYNLTDLLNPPAHVFLQAVDGEYVKVDPTVPG